MKPLLIFLFLFSTLHVSARDYLTSDHRVAADGTTLVTAQLQRLIDRASRDGGGRVVLTPGRYLSGQLDLKSNVEFHLQAGATLLGSTSPYDYYMVNNPKDKTPRRLDASHLALVSANGATNIAITGQGTIDGQGLQLALNADSLHQIGEYVDSRYNERRRRPSELMRPTLFFINHCAGVRVSDLHLRNSASWGLSFDHSRDILLTDLNIYNRAYWNNDGIDLTDCQQATIQRCYVNSADDGICLKSTDPESSCDSITITDCEVRSSASAVKTGTGSYGGFRHITIRRIRVFDTFRSAIALETVDGGLMEHVLVEDVSAVNTGNALLMRLGRRDGDRNGAMRHITVRRLSCQIPFGRPDIDYDLRGPEVDYFHNVHPAVIAGLADNPIEDVTLEDITLSYPGRATRGMAYVPLWNLDAVPENEKGYPEFTMFGELPAWALYARHATGLTIRRCNLSLAADDYRPAFVLDDIRQLSLTDLSLPLRYQDNQVYMRDVEVR